MIKKSKLRIDHTILSISLSRFLMWKVNNYSVMQVYPEIDFLAKTVNAFSFYVIYHSMLPEPRKDRFQHILLDFPLIRMCRLSLQMKVPYSSTKIIAVEYFCGDYPDPNLLFFWATEAPMVTAVASSSDLWQFNKGSENSIYVPDISPKQSWPFNWPTPCQIPPMAAVPSIIMECPSAFRPLPLTLPLAQ